MPSATLPLYLLLLSLCLLLDHLGLLGPVGLGLLDHLVLQDTMDDEIIALLSPSRGFSRNGDEGGKTENSEDNGDVLDGERHIGGLLECD